MASAGTPAPRPGFGKQAGDPREATAILVLGMHRSGTSAIARVLNLRGADLGRELLPAKEDNERGFWENRAILELHETCLAAQGLRWHDLVALPADWQQAAPARRFVADLPAVLKQQFADRRLFTVKDPRLSLLAPLWIEALTAAAVRPVFVITIRHPAEVAASLARRDGLPPAQSQLLWLQHLIDAERATRGQARVFVHYERLLADWRAELARIGAQLAIGWPPAPADFDAAVSAFLAPTLRHHRAGNAESEPLLPIVAQAYAQASAASGDSAPAAPFAAIEASFDMLIGAVAPVYRELDARRSAERDEHAREIERARAAFAIKEEEIARAREAFGMREAEIDAARANIEALNGDLARARDVIAGKDREIDAARVNVDTLTTELGLARDNIHALAGEITLAREAFAAKEREIDAARDSVETLTADLESARAAHAARDREIDALRNALAAREREIDAARANIDALAADIERARAGFAAKDAEIDAARRNIDNLVAQIDAARQAHAVRDTTEAALRGELAALRQSRWFRLGRALRLIDRRDA